MVNPWVVIETFGKSRSVAVCSQAHLSLQLFQTSHVPDMQTPTDTQTPIVLSAREREKKRKKMLARSPAVMLKAIVLYPSRDLFREKATTCQRQKVTKLTMHSGECLQPMHFARTIGDLWQHFGKRPLFWPLEKLTSACPLSVDVHRVYGSLTRSVSSDPASWSSAPSTARSGRGSGS